MATRTSLPEGRGEPATSRVDGDESFAEHVRRALTATPKSLSPRFLYDALGSKLFDAICCLDEYYVTRAEREILAARLPEMLCAMPGPWRFIELGSGSGDKTELVLEAALRRQSALDFVPIELSSTALDACVQRLATRLPSVTVHPIASSWTTGLAALPPPAQGVHDVVLFLGSSIGNLAPDEARALFETIRATVGPNGAVLLGADLKKSPAVLVPAYDDPTGVTAAFNLNLLGRINRELGGTFDLRSFRHVALYDEQHGRIEMHLESLRRQSVRIESLALDASFDAGERIHTENSYKYEREDVRALARSAGLDLVGWWTDGRSLFGSSVLRPAAGAGPETPQATLAPATRRRSAKHSSVARKRRGA